MTNKELLHNFIQCFSESLAQEGFIRLENSNAEAILAEIDPSGQFQLDVAYLLSKHKKSKTPVYVRRFGESLAVLTLYTTWKVDQYRYSVQLDITHMPCSNLLCDWYSRKFDPFAATIVFMGLLTNVFEGFHSPVNLCTSAISGSDLTFRDVMQYWRDGIRICLVPWMQFHCTEPQLFQYSFRYLMHPVPDLSRVSGMLKRMWAHAEQTGRSEEGPTLTPGEIALAAHGGYLQLAVDGYKSLKEKQTNLSRFQENWPSILQDNFRFVDDNFCTNFESFIHEMAKDEEIEW